LGTVFLWCEIQVHLGWHGWISLIVAEWKLAMSHLEAHDLPASLGKLVGGRPRRGFAINHRGNSSQRIHGLVREFSLLEGYGDTNNIPVKHWGRDNNLSVRNVELNFYGIAAGVFP
jgi:hypothetical protein